MGRESWCSKSRITPRCVAKALGHRSLLTVLLTAQCLKFKTHSSVFLNRFDALNLALMQKMQNRRPTQASTAPSTSQAPQSAAPEAGASASLPAPSGPSGGGVKKKKPKKKK